LAVLKLATAKPESAANNNEESADANEAGNNHGAGIAFNVTPRANKRA
jgi:hypothetical protein